MPAHEDTWWTINGADLHAALERVAKGEDPDLMYAELYANTERDDDAEPEG